MVCSFCETYSFGRRPPSKRAVLVMLERNFPATRKNILSRDGVTCNTYAGHVSYPVLPGVGLAHLPEIFILGIQIQPMTIGDAGDAIVCLV